MRTCSCNGSNENCYRCSGKGYYDPEESSFTRVPESSTRFRDERWKTKSSKKRKGKVSDFAKSSNKKAPETPKTGRNSENHPKITKSSNEKKKCPYCEKMKVGLADHIRAVHKNALSESSQKASKISATNPIESKAGIQPDPRPARPSKATFRKKLKNNQSMLAPCGTASIGWLEPKEKSKPRTRRHHFSIREERVDGNNSDLSSRQQWQLERRSQECDASEIAQGMIKRDVFGKFSSGEEPEMPTFNLED